MAVIASVAKQSLLVIASEQSERGDLIVGLHGSIAISHIAVNGQTMRLLRPQLLRCKKKSAGPATQHLSSWVFKCFFLTR